MKITSPFHRVDDTPDVTDPNDTFVPPDEPSEQDFAMNDLLKTVRTLEQNTPFGYGTELDASIARLCKVAETVRKPF